MPNPRSLWWRITLVRRLYLAHPVIVDDSREPFPDTGCSPREMDAFRKDLNSTLTEMSKRRSDITQ